MVMVASKTPSAPELNNYADLRDSLKRAAEHLDTEDMLEAAHLGMPGEPETELEQKHFSNLETLNCLPTNKNGILYPEFWRYYLPPFNAAFLYNPYDRFNDLVIINWGPRGGGKTVTAVTHSIVDAQMRGIPVISNVPISWVAKDMKGKLYKVESLPFDVEAFADGDSSLRNKRLLIDEGNYLADRLRSTSNKNLAMTDILQQARKFRMCVNFCTINWAWLDPRVTGSLLDIKIECNDLYYDYGFRRKHNLKKGWRIKWQVADMSGKCSGHVREDWINTTFNARLFWNTYDTEKFVDNKEARRKLTPTTEKFMVNQDGEEVWVEDWEQDIAHQLKSLSKARPTWWESEELWNTLRLDEFKLKQRAGRIMHKLGIDKKLDKAGRASYDLTLATV